MTIQQRGLTGNRGSDGSLKPSSPYSFPLPDKITLDDFSFLSLVGPKFSIEGFNKEFKAAKLDRSRLKETLDEALGTQSRVEITSEVELEDKDAILTNLKLVIDTITKELAASE
jgi:hypothetical protein